MEDKNKEVGDLSTKISNLGWDEFHTLLNPVLPDEDLDMLAIVEKIHANRVFSSNVVIATLKAAWSFVQKFSIDEMEPNIFLFRFSKAEDQVKVLAQNPWNIWGHLMVVKPWSSELTLPEVDFYSEGMWIQVHGLPWNRIGDNTIQLIGLKLGKLLEIDKLEYRDQDRKPFFRIRVDLNLRQPLVGGFPIPRCQL